MNSRLTATENMRAIKLAYIPAGKMLAVPDNEGGGEWRKFDPEPESQTMSRIAESSSTMLGAYKTIARDRGAPVAYVPTFSQVPDVDPGFMNQRVVTKRKSYLPVVAFDNFKSELYPRAPPLWTTSVGDPARLFER